MPSGVGAAPAVNDSRLPAGLVINPDAFFTRTERRVRTPISFAAPGGNQSEQRRLPATGILGKLRVQFVGTLTTTLGAGTVTTGPRWPYGLVDLYQLTADQRTDVFRWDGLDAHVLRAVRHSAALLGTGAGRRDVIPGGMGEGQTIPNGASDVVLTWEIPIPIDDETLIGSLFAQSDNVNLTQIIRQAAAADLMVAAGGATIDSLTGTFYTQVTSFGMPIVGDGQTTNLVSPDISLYHSVQAAETQFQATGEVPVRLTRGAGQLSRLLVQVSSGTDRAVTTNPYLRTSPDLNEIDEIRLEYGAGQRTLTYSPAHLLTDENDNAYGQALPYRYVALDFLRENPPRDVINMPGVTDLEVVVTVNSAVTPAAGARVRVVAEMLLQGQGA